MAPQTPGQGNQRICELLERIAIALEGKNQSITYQTDAKASVSETDCSPNPSPISPSQGPKPLNWMDDMHYEGSQVFYNYPCSKGCPKAISCVEFLPGEKCIGWKTRNYKGGK